ncbi:MAG: hypothetical protein JWQ21_1611 [Herminiimonas sp.]|nr:hypothetical protein [Herminiimonas sp.]
MTSVSSSTVARFVRAARILAVLIGVSSIAHGATETAYGTNATDGTPALKTKPAATSSTNTGKGAAKSAPSQLAKPLWAELTPAQQQALAPLAVEWDKLDAQHKKKWLTIGNRYGSLKPDQQIRLQNRMRDWTKLTPEQRRVARESYSRAKKLNPVQKSAEWQQYQQLPEEQKKKLAAEAAAKKPVANLPPAYQSKAKVTPPPKSALKAHSGSNQTVIPPATETSAAQPVTQPAVK